MGQTLAWAEMGQVLLAALLGGVIGYERETTGHAAGLRTLMLIAIGSCLFTVLSVSGFPLRGNAQDTARIAAQVVSGVGFIGAGLTFRTEERVKGLTTAATVWLVAAIGMAVGVGAYDLAIFTTVLTFGVLRLLLPVAQILDERSAEKEAPASAEPPSPGG